MNVRSWYGLSGEIEVEHQLRHLVRIAGVPLGHPPVINTWLRNGLDRDERLQTSFLLVDLQRTPPSVAQSRSWPGER